jgi:hypothetical protein
MPQWKRISRERYYFDKWIFNPIYKVVEKVIDILFSIFPK